MKLKITGAIFVALLATFGCNSKKTAQVNVPPPPELSEPQVAAQSDAYVPSKPKPCPIGTLATYAGLICTQDEVTYVFHPDFYKQEGSFVVKPGDVTVRLDPNGPYTLLIGSKLWNLKAGQSLTTTLTFKVKGANKVNAWAHNCFATGDGRVDASQIIFYPDASQPTITATASCTAGSSSEPQHGAQYGGGMVDTQVVIHLEGGKTGSAKLQSLGTHYHP